MRKCKAAKPWGDFPFPGRRSLPLRQGCSYYTSRHWGCAYNTVIWSNSESGVLAGHFLLSVSVGHSHWDPAGSYVSGSHSEECLWFPSSLTDIFLALHVSIVSLWNSLNNTVQPSTRLPVLQKLLLPHLSRFSPMVCLYLVHICAGSHSV